MDGLKKPKPTWEERAADLVDFRQVHGRSSPADTSRVRARCTASCKVSANGTGPANSLNLGIAIWMENAGLADARKSRTRAGSVAATCDRAGRVHPRTRTLSQVQDTRQSYRKIWPFGWNVSGTGYALGISVQRSAGPVMAKSLNGLISRSNIFAATTSSFTNAPSHPACSGRSCVSGLLTGGT